MTTTYPATLTDATGRTWEWSEQWGGYRSEGMTTHGYDTIRDQWGIATEPQLSWPREAERLHDQLAARGVIDPESGERFTVVRCDDAIQSAVETFNAREGTRIIDIFDLTWWELGDDIARALGIDYDEMLEVAP